VTSSSDEHHDVSRPSLLEVTTVTGSMTSVVRHY
jgi:hypothetical protein